MTNELVEIAQESASASAFEARVLALLQREIGFDAAFFLVNGQPATTVGFDENVSALLLARSAVYAQELEPVKRAALAARGVAVDTEICGLRRVQRARYFREVAATIGGQHSLMAYLPWNGGVLAAIMLGRCARSFAQFELQRVEALLPTLGLARAAFGVHWSPGPLPLSRIPIRRRWLPLGSRALATVPAESGTLVVRDRAGFREMLAFGRASELVWTRAALADPCKSGWPYVELLHLAPALARHRRRVLFVGSGGAVSVHQFAKVYPGIAIDLVERDPAVVELARTWFALGTIPRLAVHIADGVPFIRNAWPGSWDIVVIDAYDASDCASAFLQYDFLSALHRVLEPGGAVAFNVMGALRGPGPVSALVASARAVFEKVRVLPVIDPDESYSADALRNVVVVAIRGDVQPSSLG